MARKMATDMYPMRRAVLAIGRKDANMNETKNDLQAKIKETKGLIERATTAHAFMKAVNKYFRKKGTCRGFSGMTEEKAIELNAQVNSTSNAPFNSKELADSNNDLRQLKERLMSLQDQRTEEVQS